MREGSELLVAERTIIGGRPLDPLPPDPPAPWVEEPIWPESTQPFTAQQGVLRERGHTPEAMAAAAERAAASTAD